MDFTKDSNLMNGKGENDNVEWITVKGNHIPIKKGQSPNEAIKNHFDNKIKVNNKLLSDNVDDILNDKYKAHYITISEHPSKIFKSIGMEDKPLMMTAKHTYLAINKSGKYTHKNDHYHDLGKELFLQLPTLLEKPKAIYQSPKDKNDIVVILDGQDKNNNVLICPIKINGLGQYNEVNIQSNIVKSFYGRKNLENYLSKNFNNEDIVFLDNKKIRELHK